MKSSSAGLEGYEALWIIDYGTKTLPVGAQIRRKNQPPAPGRTSILCLQGQSRTEAPQIVGYLRRNGSLQFVWGYELSRLQQSPKEGDLVVVATFERLKLAILGTANESLAARKRIEDELRELDVPEKSAEDLFVRHLVALKPAIASAVSKEFASSLSHRTAQQISELPVHVFFAAPEIADLGKLHNLSKLLMRAGFPDTTLVPEAEAAGAWHAFRFGHETLDPRVTSDTFAPGTELVVCDVGGWTCNVSSFTICGSPANGARMGMKSTGRMRSEPLGSEMINLKFLQFIKQTLRDGHEGDFTKALNHFGITENALDYSASNAFDSFKIFVQQEPSRTIEVKGTESGRGFTVEEGIPSAYCEVTAEQVKEWIDELSSSMITVIESIRTTNSKLLTMTGGFSFNTYLIEVLKNRFEPSGLAVIAAGKNAYGSSDLAVVNGAPARFDVEAKKLPFKYALGMAVDEHYVPALHTDMATDLIGPIPDPDDPDNEARDWVPGRYVEILPRGQPMDNSYRPLEKWLKCDVLEKEIQYEKEIFYTLVDIPAHAPTRPNGGPLRADLKVFDTIKATFTLGDVMGMPLTDPESHLPKTSSPANKGPAVHQPGTRKSSRTKRQTTRFAEESSFPEDEPSLPEHELFLKLTITLEEMLVSVKVERPRNGYNMYEEGFSEDTGEQVRLLRTPGQVDLIHVTSTSLLDGKYYPQLQREEGTEGVLGESDDEDDEPLIERKRRRY